MDNPHFKLYRKLAFSDPPLLLSIFVRHRYFGPLITDGDKLNDFYTQTNEILKTN